MPSPPGSRREPGTRGTPQVFRLFGYAGTGKTTLARHLAEDVDGEVAFAAFTGKAALVMRAQGLRRRLHHPQPDLPRARQRRGDAELRIVGRCAGLQGEPHRHRRMLDGRRRARPRPALVRRAGAGAGRSGAAAADPGRRLLHRGRARRDADRGAPPGAGRPDHPPVDAVREGERLEPGRYGESEVVRAADLDPQRVLDADQVLVGRNATRRAYNARLRERRGFAERAAGGGRQAGLPAQQPPQGPVQRRPVDGQAARRRAAPAS